MFKATWAITAALAVSVAFSASPAQAKKAGFRIDSEVSVRKDGTLSIQRNEPGLSMAIRGDIAATQAVDVALIALPRPVSPEWAQAIAPDPARSVPIPAEGGKTEILPLQPVVFRALFVPEGDGVMQVYNALLSQDGQGFLVLLPAGSGASMKGTLSVISNDGRYLLTSQSESVDLKAVRGARLKKGRLPESFFQDHLSPLPLVGTLTREDQDGRQFFADLEALFTERFALGEAVYSARPHTSEFLAAYTSLNSFGDKYVSCGNAAIGSGGPIGLVASVVMSMPRVLSSNDCLARRPSRQKEERN